MRVSMVDPSLFTLPYDQALAKGLEDIGHKVMLHGRRLGPDDNALQGRTAITPDFYRFAGSRAVSSLPNALRLGVKGLDHVWSMVHLLRRLRRERPDVIHFQWLPLPLVDGRMLAAFRRVAPLVLTVHDTNPFNGDPSAPVQADGMQRCFPAFGRLILHTRQGMARLVERGVDPVRIAILPHGPLPVEGGTQHGPDALSDVADPPTFTLFGKLKPYKGADVLIEAFGRLPTRLRGQARVRIIGKPYMDLAPLHAIAARHGVQDQVSIEPRFVPDTEIPEVLSPGTVAVFPYREIEASGVLLQALALGRPVVASQIGCMAELLEDGVQGHLVPPDDPAALSMALSRFINDRPFRLACSRNAWRLSRDADGWETIAERTAALYRDART